MKSNSVKDDTFRKVNQSGIASSTISYRLYMRQPIAWPKWLQWLPCAKWQRYTWYGLSAMVSGGFLQSGIAIFNIYGTLNPFITSRYKVSDTTLTADTTIYGFPIYMFSIAIAMQIGAWLMHKISLKLQILLGTVIFTSAVYLSQFAQTYTGFVLIYNVMAGLGIGIIFFLPIHAGWSFFPHVKPIIAGSQFSWCSIASIMYSAVTVDILQTYTQKPIKEFENDSGKYYSANQPQVQNFPQLLTAFSGIALVCMLAAIPFIRYNYAEGAKKKN